MVNKADLIHISRVIDWAMWVRLEYPELLNKEEDEELLIVIQLLEEKLQ